MSILTTNNLTSKSFWFYFSKNSIKQRTIDNTIQLKWELLQDPGSRTICVQAARLQTLLHCLSASSCCCCGVELQTKLREGFTITEKVPTSRAFSWLEAHLVGAFSVIMKFFSVCSSSVVVWWWCTLLSSHVKLLKLCPPAQHHTPLPEYYLKWCKFVPAGNKSNTTSGVLSVDSRCVGVLTETLKEWYFSQIGWDDRWVHNLCLLTIFNIWRKEFINQNILSIHCNLENW